MLHNSKVIAFCITLLVITAWSSSSQAKSLKSLMEEAADAAPATNNKTIDDFTFAPLKAPEVGFMNQPRKNEYREVTKKYMTEDYFTGMENSIKELNGGSAANTCKIKIYAPPEGSDETDMSKFSKKHIQVGEVPEHFIRDFIDYETRPETGCGLHSPPRKSQRHSNPEGIQIANRKPGRG